MGATDDFPHATFYVQERELSKWVWAMSLGRRFRWLMGATDPGDILRAVDLARQGRLVCVDGDMEDVLPGIDLHAAFDTHTWGSMFVNVRVDGKQPSKDAYILAGDLIYIPTPTWKVRTRKIRNTFRSAWPAEAKQICC